MELERVDLSYITFYFTWCKAGSVATLLLLTLPRLLGTSLVLWLPFP